ncbi:MAG: phage portal protein [Ruminococcus sp.]|nr:phage portal protein [Ruminococcus sp.]
MGLFDFIFGPKAGEPRREAEETFKLLSGYTPVFHTWDGGIYESELVRAAIDARARHISKLNVQVVGTAKPSLQSKLRLGPNAWATWSQTLYRLSTILDVRNTAVIVPIIDENGETTGIYPVLYKDAKAVQYGGEPWLRMEFYNGDRVAIELRRVGIMTKYQYTNDLFGETNKALDPTMDLLNIQKQGIEEGVKNAASYRFMATMANFMNDEDIAKERERFTAANLRKGGGVLLWKNTMKDVKQIEAKPYIADADQVKLINDNVNRYFGVNSEILENAAVGDSWAAFYEGAIEPFAIQLSEVLTKMLFTQKEREKGTYIMATANRLQYMSNADKLAVSAQMADRGLMSRNEIREIWNLPPLPPEIGDGLPVRGEYYDLTQTQEATDE